MLFFVFICFSSFFPFCSIIVSLSVSVFVAIDTNCLFHSQIEKLQASIQTLCKSANPLGKIMDYMQVTNNQFIYCNLKIKLSMFPKQEDVESMQKELEMWQADYVKHTESLQREERSVNYSVDM